MFVHVYVIVVVIVISSARSSFVGDSVVSSVSLPHVVELNYLAAADNLLSVQCSEVCSVSDKFLVLFLNYSGE